MAGEILVGDTTVYRTSIEESLGVYFPNDQSWFGMIQEGIFDPEHFKHTHLDDRRYTFAEGTVANLANSTWDRLVEDAYKLGKDLFSDPTNPNLSLLEVQNRNGKLEVTTQGITYREYRIATEPEFQNLIAQGEVEPHLMLAQCQIVRVPDRNQILFTWRSPKNEYMPESLHAVGGHHKRSERDIWQTFRNELRDEIAIAAEAIDTTVITGVGWNRELQKPELLAVTTLKSDAIIQPGKGRGVRVIPIADRPSEIKNTILNCFPHVVPVGIAGLYTYLKYFHKQEGERYIDETLDEIKWRLNQLKNMDEEEFITLIQSELPQSVNQARILTFEQPVEKPGYHQRETDLRIWRQMDESEKTLTYNRCLPIWRAIRRDPFKENLD